MNTRKVERKIRMSEEEGWKVGETEGEEANLTLPRVVCGRSATYKTI